jgi:hypothetical protein
MYVNYLLIDIYLQISYTDICRYVDRQLTYLQNICQFHADICRYVDFDADILQIF